MLPFTDMSVLERQKSRFKWQQEQQQQHQIQEDNSFGELGRVFQFQQVQQTFNGDLGEVVIRSVKPDPGLLDNSCWNSGLISGSSGFDISFALSRTTSCPPTVATAVDVAVLAKARDSVASEKLKRKSAGKDENHRDKRVKVCAEDRESVAKVTDKSNSKGINSNSKNSNKDNSGETSKDNSKVTEVQKPDYIHVRARRGQATDSHSLAERVRREKISERMKYLQDLVPGCNKITGKAGMLDEIINYVQSLQRQVEFLSMKLAAVNPRLDFNIDNLIAKETFPPCPTNFPAIGMSSDMTNSAAYLQFSPIQQQQQQQQQQLIMCCGSDIGINASADVGLRRTISAPVSIPESYIDSSLFNQMQPSSTWDAHLQNLYNVALDQGRSTSFPTQPFTGTIDASNLNMEM